MNTSIFNEQLVNSNSGQLAGKIVRGPVKTHEAFDENFYEIMLEVKRLSDNVDILPVTIGERLIDDMAKLEEGKNIAVTGEYRSLNKLIGDRSKLILYFFAKNILPESEANKIEIEQSNYLKLVGYICKPPVLRGTPFNRVICDALMAVNRVSNNKSDYIPCISWGKSAQFMGRLDVGTKIELEGRIQSRGYKKQVQPDVYEDRVAYEVSCKTFQVIENAKAEPVIEIG